MVKDYQTIWAKWIGFLQSDLKIRKEVLESLHLDVRQGFTIIAKTSREELEHLLAQTEFFGSVREELETTLLYCVWCGYLLYLISEGIDPVENNLVMRTQTNELGNMWMDAYESDKCASLLAEIDPLLSLLLQNISQSELNQLLIKSSGKVALSYDHAVQIVSLLQWALCQGFIFGLIEQKLFEQKEVEK